MWLANQSLGLISVVKIPNCSPIWGSTWILSFEPAYFQSWVLDRFLLTRFHWVFLRSKHMRILPSGLGTTTMPEHQSLGMSTLEMTPRFSIRSNSAFTLLIRGSSAPLRGGVKAKGVESGCCVSI